MQSELLSKNHLLETVSKHASGEPLQVFDALKDDDLLDFVESGQMAYLINLLGLRVSREASIDKKRWKQDLTLALQLVNRRNARKDLEVQAIASTIVDSITLVTGEKIHFEQVIGPLVILKNTKVGLNQLIASCFEVYDG